jgi:threonine dehydratase
VQEKNMVDVDAIYEGTLEANSILNKNIRKTPLIPYPHDVYLKAENLQRSGSFKFRGAYYTIEKMDVHDEPIVAILTGGNVAPALITRVLADV